MHWYVVHVKSGRTSKLIGFFRRQEGVTAFIPKSERWQCVGEGKKDYILKELYPDYVFVRTHLSRDQFDVMYRKFFDSIEDYAVLLEYDDVYSLTKEEEVMMDRLFSKSHIIRHSVGTIIEKRLKCFEGPLVGLEDRVIKLDKRNRFATLRFEGLPKGLTMSVEVMRTV